MQRLVVRRRQKLRLRLLRVLQRYVQGGGRVELQLGIIFLWRVQSLDVESVAAFLLEKHLGSSVARRSALRERTVMLALSRDSTEVLRKSEVNEFYLARDLVDDDVFSFQVAEDDPLLVEKVEEYEGFSREKFDQF